MDETSPTEAPPREPLYSPAFDFSTPPPVGHTHIRRARGKTLTARVKAVRPAARVIMWEGACVTCGKLFEQTTGFRASKGLNRMNCDACLGDMVASGAIKGSMAANIARRLARAGKVVHLPPAAPTKPSRPAAADPEARLAALEARVLALEQRAVDPFAD